MFVGGGLKHLLPPATHQKNFGLHHINLSESNHCNLYNVSIGTYIINLCIH